MSYRPAEVRGYLVRRLDPTRQARKLLKRGLLSLNITVRNLPKCLVDDSADLDSGLLYYGEDGFAIAQAKQE